MCCCAMIETGCKNTNRHPCFFFVQYRRIVTKCCEFAAMRRLNSDNDKADVLFFDSGAFGWFLRLLFFPSGIVTLILIILLLKRSQHEHRVAPLPNEPNSHGLHSSGGDMMTSLTVGRREDVRMDGMKSKAMSVFQISVPKSDFDKEIERMCSSLKVERGMQRELESCGRIDSNSCGYCFGEGGAGGYVKLPCGHYHHSSCVRFAMRRGIVKCADCGDNILNLDKLLETIRSFPASK